MSTELKQAIARIREMQKWRRGLPPYDEHTRRAIPSTPFRHGLDIDMVLDALEKKGKAK